MPNDDIHSLQNRKRRMADRFIELRTELAQYSRNDLLLIRTSELEELGKKLKDLVDHAKQVSSHK